MRLLDATGDVELTPDEVADHLVNDGLVMIRQGSVGEVRAMLASWTAPATHPHEFEPGLTVVTPHRRGRDAAGRAGFTRALLRPHTDRSLQPEPPSLLAGLMITPAILGGSPLLADGAVVLAALRRFFGPSAIDRLRLRTPSGMAVPMIAVRDGLVKIRFRDDRLAAPHSPDGEERVVAALRESISTATTPQPLGVGDGYVLHNHRYLHGRSAFIGQRRLMRILATVTCARWSKLNQGFPVANI